MAEKNNANIGFEKEIWDAAFDKRYEELVEEGYGFEDELE